MTATAEAPESLVQRIGSLFKKGLEVNAELTDSLEEILITADIGVQVTDTIIQEIRNRYQGVKIESEDEVFTIIKEHMTAAIGEDCHELKRPAQGPAVYLFVGVNGTGKTTSIGKLAHKYIQEGKKVILGAGDTFRAAAGEQLGKWAERTGADIVAHTEGGDPAAVIYDAVEAGVARKADYILLDTAGRLHTKQDLMKQLDKINRVIKKKVPEGPHEVILVIDATAGQNGLAQARQFYKDVGVTGIILAKMDGTAKGGIVMAIKRDLEIPVKYIGIGEGIEDIQPFNPAAFVDRIFFKSEGGAVEDDISRNLDAQMSYKVKGEKRSRTLLIILLFMLSVCLGLLLFSLFMGDVWMEFIQELIKVSHIADWFE